MAVKHSKTIAVSDDGDTSRAQPSDWNADHVIDDGSFSIAKTTGLQTALNARPPALYNQSTAQQGAGFASDTYLTGSDITLPAGLQAGSRYHLVFDVNKTAASTATPAITIRFGTAGSTADTGRATLTFLAQTAAADDGVFEIWVTFRTVGAATVIQAVGNLRHRLSTTGLANLPGPTVRATSASFDATPAGTKIGVSVNGGTSASWTVQLVQAELTNLAP